MQRNRGLAGHYTELGLEVGACEEDVKRAYKKLVRAIHPDKNKSPDATAKFQRVNEAYLAIINADKQTLPTNNEVNESSVYSVFNDIKRWVEEDNIDAFKNCHWQPYYDYTPNEKLALKEAMIYALNLNRKKIIQFLLLYFPGLAAIQTYDESSDLTAPLIYFAVKAGRLGCVRLFTNMNANELRDGLLAAVIYGHYEIAEYLLGLGAVTEYLHNGQTLLGRAASANQIEMIELLLKHGASIPNAIETAYKQYISAIADLPMKLAAELSDTAREALIVEGFGLSYNVYHRRMLEPLINLLSDSTTLDKRQSMILDYANDFFKYHATILPVPMLVGKVINALHTFDAEKQTVLKKLECHRQAYSHILKTLMDYGTGINFTHSQAAAFFGLQPYQIRVPDLNEVNLIGVRLNGEPITPERFYRVNHALLTINDLTTIDDAVRRQVLTAKVNAWRAQASQTGLFALPTATQKSPPANRESRPSLECKLM